MFSWLTSLFGSPLEDAKTHAEAERQRAEEESDSGGTREEAVDPANPVSTPASREQDVRDEVQRALLAAHVEAASSEKISHTEAQGESIDALKAKIIRGETDTGVVASDLHQQAEIEAEIRRFATLNAGVGPAATGRDADEITDSLHPSVAAGTRDQAKKNRNWKDHPAGFLQKKPLHDE